MIRLRHLLLYKRPIYQSLMLSNRILHSTSSYQFPISAILLLLSLTLFANPKPCGFIMNHDNSTWQSHLLDWADSAFVEISNIRKYWNCVAEASVRIVKYGFWFCSRHCYVGSINLSSQDFLKLTTYGHSHVEYWHFNS